MTCQNMPSGWNDRVSSLAIFRTTGGESAVGKWVGFTGTEQLDFTYHVGFDTTKSSEEQITEQYTLAYEMNTGINFEFESSSETISSSYSASIMTDAQSSMDLDIEIDWTLHCTGSIGSEGGVGLWQWKVQSSD